MYKRILIAVEDGLASTAASHEGVMLAKALGAEVVFFHVLPRYVIPAGDIASMVSVSSEDFDRDARINGSELLARAAAVAEQAGVPCQSAMDASAADAECIANAAKTRQCDLIVVASTGRNAVMRLLTGSAIPGLITMASVPVLVCRGSEPRADGGASNPT